MENVKCIREANGLLRNGVITKEEFERLEVVKEYTREFVARATVKNEHERKATERRAVWNVIEAVIIATVIVGMFGLCLQF